VVAVTSRPLGTAPTPLFPCQVVRVDLRDEGSMRAALADAVCHPYGESKVAAEQAIETAAMGGAIGAARLRIFNAAGAVAGVVRVLISDHTRIGGELGWSPARSALREIVADAWDAVSRM
jgi:UDP-glucose 4-epimerase